MSSLFRNAVLTCGFSYLSKGCFRRVNRTIEEGDLNAGLIIGYTSIGSLFAGSSLYYLYHTVKEADQLVNIVKSKNDK